MDTLPAAVLDWTGLLERDWTGLPGSYWTGLPGSYWTGLPGSYWTGLPEFQAVYGLQERKNRAQTASEAGIQWGKSVDSKLNY